MADFSHCSRIFHELMADAKQQQALPPAWPSPDDAYAYSTATADASTRDTLLASDDAADPDDDLAGCIQQAVAAYLQNPDDAIPQELLDDAADDESAWLQPSPWDASLHGFAREALQQQQQLLLHQHLQAQALGYPSMNHVLQAAQVPHALGLLLPQQAVRGGLRTMPIVAQASREAKPAKEAAPEPEPRGPATEIPPFRARRRPQNPRTDHSRYWCSFHLTQVYTQFAVVPAIIGKGGINTRTIFQKTGAKIRVRGRGSGHMESATGKEAPAGLMVTVSSNALEWDGFVAAVELTGQLISKVQTKMYEMTDRQFAEVCWQVVMHDGKTYRLQDGRLVTEVGGVPVNLQHPKQWEKELLQRRVAGPESENSAKDVAHPDGAG